MASNSDQASVEFSDNIRHSGNIRVSPQVGSQNLSQLLAEEENGGDDLHIPLTGHDKEIYSEWLTVLNRRKRQRVSTGSQNLDEYQKLSVDDKLSVMFAEMGSIGNKVDQCLQLHTKVQCIEKQITEHQARLNLLEYKSLDQEARNRRNNLIIGGIAEMKNENCYDTIAMFLKNELGIDPCPPTPRVHRLGRYNRDSTRAVIVNFLDTRDTEYVISQAKKLKGTKYNINRDYPQEIANARRVLWPEYKKLRENYPDSKVGLAYPAKIILDGKVYADMFPHWNLIMKGDRLPASKPVFTNIIPARAQRGNRDSDDTVPTVSSQASLSTQQRGRSYSRSPASSQHRSRARRQSTSQNQRKGVRGYAPSRSQSSNRVPVDSISTKRTEPAIKRPWASDSVNNGLSSSQ